MNIVIRPLNKMTKQQWKRCSALTFGYDDGYMYAMMREHKDTPGAKALMLYRGRAILGWALLIPSPSVSIYWDVSNYHKKRSKYVVQVYVSEYFRERGYGRKIMNAVMKQDARPFVYSHSEAAGALYSPYTVTTTAEYRLNLKKRKAA